MKNFKIKRLVTLFMCMIMVLAMTACSSKRGVGSKDDDEEVVEEVKTKADKEATEATTKKSSKTTEATTKKSSKTTEATTKKTKMTTSAVTVNSIPGTYVAEFDAVDAMGIDTSDIFSTLISDDFSLDVEMKLVFEEDGTGVMSMDLDKAFEQYKKEVMSNVDAFLQAMLEQRLGENYTEESLNRYLEGRNYKSYNDLLEATKKEFDDEFAVVSEDGLHKKLEFTWKEESGKLILTYADEPDDPLELVINSDGSLTNTGDLIDTEITFVKKK